MGTLALSTFLGQCSVSDCVNVADRQTESGPMCPTHRKRLQPERAGNVPLSAPVVKDYASPLERLKEAAIAWADASSEDDRAYVNADKRLQRAAKAYGEHLAREERQDFLRKQRRGIAKAKRNGVQFGRPPKLVEEAIRQALAERGSIRQAARALGVTRRGLQLALRRLMGVGTHGAMHALGGTRTPVEVPTPPEAEATPQETDAPRLREEPAGLQQQREDGDGGG